MPIQRHKFQTFSGGHAPGPPRWTNIHILRTPLRKRKYPLGAQKARLADEKRESMLLAASSTRKMNDFFQSRPGSSSFDENSQMPSQNSIGSQGSQESSLSMTGISETEPDTSKGAESEIDKEVNKRSDPEIDPEVNESSEPEIEPVVSLRPDQGVDNDIGLWSTWLNDRWTGRLLGQTVS